ncbi:hypothetical protein ADK48_19805 [Streptomyces rimosus subsp. rimosus]|nr:hypothetical protein ADK48_19805 [Streptomyces rimosus subsp. rimosus]
MAGSRVVPTTRMGAAPRAVMRCAAPVGLTGQYAQFRAAQAKLSPKTGDALRKAGRAARTSSGLEKAPGRARPVSYPPPPTILIQLPLTALRPPIFQPTPP